MKTALNKKKKEVKTMNAKKTMIQLMNFTMIYSSRLERLPQENLF